MANKKAKNSKTKNVDTKNVKKNSNKKVIDINKIMTIIIAILVVIILLITLTKCSSNKNEEKDKKDKKIEEKEEIEKKDDVSDIFIPTNDTVKSFEAAVVPMVYEPVVVSAPVEVKDTTSPVARVIYSTTEPTNEGVVITIIASEKLQEVDGWTLSDDKMSISKTVTENESKTVIIKDLAGNTTEVKYEVTNIDTDGPELAVTYSTEELTNQDVIVTITADEEILEVEGWTLSEDGMSISLPVSVNTEQEITVTVSDLLGNTTDITYDVENIDKENPYAINNTPSYSTKEPTRDDVVVTIEVNEEVTTTDTAWEQNGNVFTKTVTKNGIGKLVVTDLAGNTSTITYDVENIDTTLPTGIVSYSETRSTVSPVTITIEASENVTTTDTTWTQNGTTFTKTTDSNTSGTLAVTDLAGNSNNISYSVSNIVGSSTITSMQDWMGNTYYSINIVIDGRVSISNSDPNRRSWSSNYNRRTQTTTLTGYFTDSNTGSVIIRRNNTDTTIYY